MAYKWRPSKAQRRAFAEKMNTDPEFAAAYEERKNERAQRRRNASRFDYNTAGGAYIPTKAQHDFCLANRALFAAGSEEEAADMVIFGYSCQTKVGHDYIHVVNEKMRNNPNL